MDFASRFLAGWDSGRQDKQAAADEASRAQEAQVMQEDRMMKRRANLSSIYVSAPEQARPILRQRYAREFMEAGLDPNDPNFDSTAQAFAVQNQGEQPAGFRQAHLTAVAAGYQPGTPEYQKAMQVAAGTAPRAIPAGYTTRNYRDANGQEVVELVQIRGEGAGGSQQVPAPAAPQPPQQPSLAASGGDPQMDALANAANAMIKAGIPPEQVDAFLMQTAQASPQVQVNPPTMTPTANAAPLPPSANAVGGGPVAPLPGSGRGQTDDDRARAAADQAARVEAARIAAQQAAAPRQAELDAQREAAITSARSGATNQAERDAVQRTNNTAFAQYTAARDTLLTDLAATSTGPIAGRLPAVTEGQQIAEGAQARMAPILKGLFRTAGEGTFTDKDQALLMAMVPTRTDLPGAVKAKMAGIDAIIEAKLQQGGGQSAQQDSPPVPGARKAPDGNWYVQQNGQTFKVEL